MIAIHTTTDTVAMWVILAFIMAFVGFCFWNNRHRVVAPEKPKEYNLRKISDLLQIPTERRMECMTELFLGLERIEIIREEMRNKLPRWLRWSIPLLVRFKFVWKDDSTIYVNHKEVWSSKEEA